MIYFKVFRKDASGKSQSMAVKRKPKATFAVEGYQFELYAIRVLAEALSRTKNTILRWESEGNLPKPMYDIPSSHQKRKIPSGEVIENVPRWYSGDQILNLHNVFVLRYDAALALQGEKLTNFFKDVRKVFYERRLLTHQEIQAL